MSATPDYFSLLAALATAALHLVLNSDGSNAYFIVGACLFWIGFVVFRWRRSPSMLREWGFRTDNLRAASEVPFLFFVASGVALAAYAIARGTFTVPLHLPLLMLLYPIWGVIQQFLVLGVVVSNLEKLPFFRDRRVALVVLGAAVFGGVHYPHPLLMGGTTLLALLYVPLYLRDRNLWPLGGVHGWVGSLFYLWALGIDPWVQNFG